MSRLMGGILGGLFMLIPAALLLVASQGPTCSNRWILSCTPSSDAAFKAQLVGGLLLIVGPYAGYRLGSRLGPHLGRTTAIGVGLGAIPGLASLAWHWWAPYAVGLMVAGSIVGGAIAWFVIERRLR